MSFSDAELSAKFDSNGNLSPGVHFVSLEDVERTFAWNAHRRMLFAGLKEALTNLAKAGIRRVWIDGSFVTRKENPKDIDGCWEMEPNLDESILDPVFVDTNPPREAMKTKYGVDFLISGTRLVDQEAAGGTVEEFFQVDRNGNRKGILFLEIEDLT
ncbi:MAG TPA: hypothetical protein PLG59_10500 [bacterium]|nr:hypothetical protein [bacterium]HQO35084.1 hypothetical protein [bacterium]HQP96835.1 hypothetical protein [bacterium]